MNQIVIITLCWQRRGILKAFLDNHYSLVPRPTIVIAGSPDDNCEDLVKMYDNCIYIKRPNIPMGKKANDACEVARNLGTHYMMTGSDDLMSQKMWDYYVNYKGDHLGLRDLYFYDVRVDKMIHWEGYRYGTVKYNMPIGAGKMVSEALMDAVNFRPYKDETKYPREHDTHKSFLSLNIPLPVMTMDEMGGACVDLKNSDSITRFQLWPNSKFVDNSELTTRAPELWPLIEKCRQ